MADTDMCNEFTLVFLFTPNLGKVLLQLKNRGPYCGRWNGVGGHLKHGESPKIGAVREVLEETGVVPELHPICSISFHNGVVLHCFCGIAPEESIQQIEDEELLWFSVLEVVSCSNGGTVLCPGLCLAGDGNVPWLVVEGRHILSYL